MTTNVIDSCSPKSGHSLFTPFINKSFHLTGCFFPSITPLSVCFSSYIYALQPHGLQEIKLENFFFKTGKSYRKLVAEMRDTVRHYCPVGPVQQTDNRKLAFAAVCKSVYLIVSLETKKLKQSTT